MNKRWMWIVCLLAAAFLVTASASLHAKPDIRESEVKASISVPSDEAMLAQMAKVTLAEAVGAALKNTPGKAIAAELEEEDGFLVYVVDIVTNDNQVTEVTVDAGNRKILKTEVEDEDEECKDEDEGGKCGKSGKYGKYEREKGGEEED